MEPIVCKLSSFSKLCAVNSTLSLLNRAWLPKPDLSEVAESASSAREMSKTFFSTRMVSSGPGVSYLKAAKMCSYVHRLLPPLQAVLGGSLRLWLLLWLLRFELRLRGLWRTELGHSPTELALKLLHHL